MTQVGICLLRGVGGALVWEWPRYAAQGARTHTTVPLLPRTGKSTPARTAPAGARGGSGPSGTNGTIQDFPTDPGIWSVLNGRKNPKKNVNKPEKIRKQSEKNTKKNRKNKIFF